MIQNKAVGEDEPATGLDISTTNRNLPISPSRIFVVTLLPNSSQVSIDSLRKPLQMHLRSNARFRVFPDRETVDYHE